jgi:small subunit ribosomal protein S6
MSEAILKKYEAIIILNSDTSTEDQKQILKKYKSTVESFNGKIASVETWGKRNLANQIDKNKKGLYFHITFEAASSSIIEIERTLRINEKVLRFMHTSLDARFSLAKHLETFKKGLAETSAKEKEREAKVLARKQAAAAAYNNTGA